MGPEIRFYHLQQTSLEAALPQILEKSLERGLRAVVKAADPAAVTRLDDHLWTFDPVSFLPHGSARDFKPGDGSQERQPVWLTDGADNPNGAKVLMVTDGSLREDMTGFEIVCDLFDGLDPGAVQAARVRWTRYKRAGHKLTYWQQGPRGGWEKKAG